MTDGVLRKDTCVFIAQKCLRINEEIGSCSLPGVEDWETPLVLQYLSALRALLFLPQNQWPSVLERIMVGNFRIYSSIPHEEMHLKVGNTIPRKFHEEFCLVF
jgi:hypothetical protein